MQRLNRPPRGADQVLTYIAIGVFTLVFWAMTLVFWYVVPTWAHAPLPNFVLTTLALPIPFIGYWSLMRAGAGESDFRLGTYIVIESVMLVLWGVAVWLWLQAYLWFEAIKDYTFVLVFFVMLLPLVALTRFRPTLPTASTNVNLADLPAYGNTVGIGLGAWLKWLGNGDAQRGVLVLLVIIFGSILYWGLVPSFNLVTFAIWGLLTIFGMVLVRSVFFRQTNLPPGPEVSAGSADSKSKAK